MQPIAPMIWGDSASVIEAPNQLNVRYSEGGLSWYTSPPWVSPLQKSLQVSLFKQQVSPSALKRRGLTAGKAGSLWGWELHPLGQEMRSAPPHHTLTAAQGPSAEGPES